MSTDATKPFLAARPPAVRVQSILYGNDKDSLFRAVDALVQSVGCARARGLCARVELAYGDSSATPVLDADDIASIQRQLPFRYAFFAENKGSARGHNTIAEGCEADFLLIMNPDVVVGAQTVLRLLLPFQSAGVGMTEAKQIPIEHPKSYDKLTGETGWAATACAMIPRVLFEALQGFDAASFFLYCDDVDFSWRVREAGFRVIYQPAAIAFHDKRLAADATWISSTAERYYSAEAALMMAHKWSRNDVLARVLRQFRRSGIAELERAAKAFVARKQAGTLPPPRDAHHRIGQFVQGRYASHRYQL
jgi:hypothetical protein